MDNKEKIKEIFYEIINALELDQQLLEQADLIQKIQETIKNKTLVETCELSITNHCGIAAGGPQPMCICTIYENGQFNTKILNWQELLETAKIQVVKNTPLIIKDVDFQGIWPDIKGKYEIKYLDGSQFFVYHITEDCDINIYC